jgi:hypothetical protein
MNISKYEEFIFSIKYFYYWLNDPIIFNNYNKKLKHIAILNKLKDEQKTRHTK